LLKAADGCQRQWAENTIHVSLVITQAMECLLGLTPICLSAGAAVVGGDVALWLG
jgi:hypothetical protein